MPYSGIPAGSALEAKIDRCVKRVMAGGQSDKSAAIAICRASIERTMETKTDTTENTTTNIEVSEDKQEKGHGPYDYENNPVAGVTSFAELDVMERAEEQHSKLRRIIDAFEAMARNIFRDPGIEPMERPAAIRNLTEEMRARLDADFERGERQISLPTIDGKLDADYLQRLINSSESIKQAIKTEGGTEYRASDYADVPDPEKPSTWKLRLAEDSSGNFTVAQVARAITAMQPGGFRGNRVELGQDKSTVINKISAAINKTDGSDEQKENLRERLNAVKAFNLELSQNHTGFKVLKSIDGNYRWLGWVSNKFMDREGEIIPEDAHLDFVKWLDDHPKAAPQLWTYHIPGTQREKRADFWGYLNGFLLLGGPLTEAEAKAFEGTKNLGMSHGFYVLHKENNIIEKYRTFEATVLPRDAAANPWTKFNVKELKDMALTPKQRELAAQLHGEEFVSALESDTNETAKQLEAAGVQSKENDDDTESKDEGVVGGNDGSQEMKALAESVAALVTKQLNPTGLQDALKSIDGKVGDNATAIKNLTERLEALEKDDDEKIAKELTPKATPGIDWMNGFRASQSKETVVKEDEKEEFSKAKPDETWASQLFSFGEGG